MTPSELQRVLERRAERAALAAATSRRNLPGSLLVLSMVLLVVALITAMWSWSDRGQAVGLLEARMQQSRVIQERAAEIGSLRTAQKNSQAGKALPTLSNQGPLKLQEACQSDRLKSVLASQPARDSVANIEAGLSLRRLQYNNLQHDSISEVLAWIENARAEIPGLEIERLTLRPGPNTWTFSITFMRYEKKEG